MKRTFNVSGTASYQLVTQISETFHSGQPSSLKNLNGPANHCDDENISTKLPCLEEHPNISSAT
ncbi:MAG TPA: hypothetical protein ACQGQX_08205, partial [Xylella taiwanensis]